MGEDGAAGLGAIKSAGGMTIAQSEESCVVSGMPRAAIAKGYANRIVPLDGLATYLSSQYGTEKTNSEKKEKDKLERAETTSVSHRN
jgi:two-component system chemotaxis response regulator CheB